MEKIKLFEEYPEQIPLENIFSSINIIASEPNSRYEWERGRSTGRGAPDAWHSSPWQPIHSNVRYSSIAPLQFRETAIIK